MCNLMEFQLLKKKPRHVLEYRRFQNAYIADSILFYTDYLVEDQSYTDEVYFATMLSTFSKSSFFLFASHHEPSIPNFAIRAQTL